MAEKKKHQIKVNLTDSEINMLKEIVECRGISIAEAVRDMIRHDYDLFIRGVNCTASIQDWGYE